MRLYITDEDFECGLTEQHFTIEQFNNIIYHPYIQSVDWDAIYVDLSDKINRGYIRQIISRKIKVIPRLVNGKISPNNVLTLIEICPDYAADFLNAQKDGQEQLLTLFNKLSDIYLWEK